MCELWSQKARSLTPYVSGEQPKEQFIKLNTNENAYSPSTQVEKAVAQASRNLRKYPPADGGEFREAAASMHGLSSKEIFCSNGSDEALAIAFMAFFDPGVPVATPDIGYSFYPVWASLFDLTLDRIPLRNDYSVDTAAFEGCKNAVLANPNAPTGIGLGEGDLRFILEHCSGTVIIDEAYAGFGGVSAIPWIHEYDNLVVVRTLSKAYALAGLRAGYVAANAELIRALETVKDSFNSYPVDTLAIAGAAAALKDREWHAQTCRKIVETRQWTVQAMEELGLEVLPSQTNFVFVRFEQPDARTVFEQLRTKKILVRHFAADRIDHFLRITIGTREEMRFLVEALKEIL